MRSIRPVGDDRIHQREREIFFFFSLNSPNVENACWNDVWMKSWSVTSPENTSFLGPVHWLSVSLNFSSRRAIKTTFQPAFERAMADARPIPEWIDLIIHLDFFFPKEGEMDGRYKPEDSPVMMAVLFAISFHWKDKHWSGLISMMRCNDVLVSQQIVVIVPQKTDVKSPPKLGEKIDH